MKILLTQDGSIEEFTQILSIILYNLDMEVFDILGSQDNSSAVSV